ncbi:MAG: hypothetical protein QNK05_08175 [Myxococcota bacterium]|nr:hypothetical protein [Myxococcota bacterium]
MIRIFLLYALSGFVSLGYQVSWFRIFADWFGSTSLVFAVVVINFVGGLGIGALLSSRVSGFLSRIGLHDRLRAYGAVELLVGTSVLLTLLAAESVPGSFGAFPYYLSDGIWMQSLLYRIGHFGVAAACVFIPCLFMGVTFPLLCHAFAAEPRGARFPSALYAWNTLGACAGVLACQFFFLLQLGHGTTFVLMAGANVLLGVYFLLAGGAPASAARTTAPPEPTPAAPTSSEDRGVIVQLVVLAAASGFVAGALEGDLFKRVSFLIYVVPGATMSFISFWAIVGIFLSSSLVNRLTSLTMGHIKIAYGLACLYAAGVWQLGDRIKVWIDPNVAVTDFPQSLLHLLAFVGIFTFPPFFLISLLLPFVCNELQRRGHHLGFAYGLNTVAFCVGLVLFALVAPSVSIFYSLKLFLVVLVVAAAFVAVMAPEPRRLGLQLGAVAVAMIVAAVATPREFDKSFFDEGSLPATNPVEAVKADAAVTTFVVKESRPVENARIYFGRMGMSGTNIEAQIYMRLMAHVPLLSHEKPTRSLLICFGVGNTASAIASHETIEQIDVVDLNANVLRTAPSFRRWSRNVHLDPRLRLINDDGRAWLRTTDVTYDLITSEPPPPLAAGVYRLYSREYYEDALAHLGEDGLMSQWLPVYQMPDEIVDLATRTFLDVFPNALLMSGYGGEWILVGSASPIDLDRMERRFSESRSVVRDLARVRVRKPADLRAKILLDDAGLRAKYPPGRVISDQRNDMEHSLFLLPTANAEPRDL